MLSQGKVMRRETRYGSLCLGFRNARIRTTVDPDEIRLLMPQVNKKGTPLGCRGVSASVSQSYSAKFVLE